MLYVCCTHVVLHDALKPAEHCNYILSACASLMRLIAFLDATSLFGPGVRKLGQRILIAFHMAVLICI
jgi:hypothetical protein